MPALRSESKARGLGLKPAARYQLFDRLIADMDALAVNALRETKAEHQPLEGQSRVVYRFVFASKRKPGLNRMAVVFRVLNLCRACTEVFREFDAAHGSWTVTEVRLCSPVCEVVLTLETWVSEVADFVGVHAIPAQKLLGLVVHLNLAILIGQIQHSAAAVAVNARIGLNGKPVEAEVLCLQVTSKLQILLPGVQALSRKSEHEVNVQVRKTRLTGKPYRPGNLIRRMDPSKPEQIVALETLRPQAEPVEARLTHGLKLGHVNRAGVGFTGDLRTGYRRMHFHDRFQDGRELLGGEVSGRAPAKEDGLRCAAGMGRAFDFAPNGIGGSLVDISRHRVAVKVTVAALARAERNVEINRDGLRVHLMNWTLVKWRLV